MSAVPDRLSAALEDRYRLGGVIGEGGMATVYLAHDLRHDRKVALKVLRPELSAIVGADRFLAEIKTTANLQHPHILPLHDSGEVEGWVFYVMPYVEGESLRDRLKREKQLPVEDALRIAREAADALDYAHRHGVIHRDVKPENIMLHEGRALVADFGIALAVSGSDGGSRMTETGLSLGTPHYMSPEQAMGERHISPKTDVYALGCVLYEMLAGEPPFTGPTAQAIVARVLTEEPRSLTVQRKSVPRYVEVAVEKALAKLPADRFGSAAAFAAALGDQETSVDGHKRMDARRPAGSARRLPIPMLLGVGVAALLTASAFGFYYRGDAADVEGPTWLSVLPPEGQFDQRPSPALSPDGRSIAFWAPDASGAVQLWLRSLDSPVARAVAGTSKTQSQTLGYDPVVQPFWSPDGRSLGFFADGSLKVVDLAAGSPRIVAAAANPRGGTWNRDGVILFAPSGSGIGARLYRVAAAGGAAVPISDASGESTIYDGWPSFLPDGLHFLFVRRTTNGETFITVGDLDGNDVQTVLPVRSRAEFSQGRILFGRDGGLFAQPFDLDRLEVTGEAVRVADHLGSSWGDINNFAFSAAGRNVATWSGASYPVTQLSWYDRSGNRVQSTGAPGVYTGFDLSPDERQAAVEGFDPRMNVRDIWLLDLANGASTLFASYPGQFGAGTPLWLPDGGRILFSRFDNSLYLQPTQGTELERLPSVGNGFVSSLSRDGSFVLMDVSGQETLDDIYVLPLSGEGKAVTYLASRNSEHAGEFSPDGHWVAYGSDESGKWEVYAQSFPKPGNKVRISTAGGWRAKWSADGTKLYYLDLDGALIEASVARAGSTLKFSPRRLFQAPPLGGDGARDQYAPTKDGRFLFNARVEGAVAPALSIGLNWAAGKGGGR